jgi:hypothetical protein
MRKIFVAKAIAAPLILLVCLMEITISAGPALAWQVRKTRHFCPGPRCGPYAPCIRCRIICPDRYSCYPLYGAYGPYGGQGFWAAYTLGGWGFR